MNALAVIASSMTRTYPVPGHRRSGVNALDVVDLALPHASFTALVGASGCGKSTLLQCVAGLDRPTSGSVRVLGTETTALRPAAAARFRADHIGFVFQEDNLVTALSARENVALPGRLRHRPLSRAQVNEALDRVGLFDQASQLPHELSGGERQRVAIARVLASRPAVVFADEPTGNLDSRATQQVLKVLRSSVDDFAQSIVMVTHEAEAAAWADTVLFLRDGRVVAQMDEPDQDRVLEALHDLGRSEGGAIPGSAGEREPAL